MKAQGKLSSWQNRMPIFLLELIDLSPSQFAQVAREHVPPRRPIMLGPAPDVQPMGDALGVEQAREGSAGGGAWLGGREQDHRDAGGAADDHPEHPPPQGGGVPPYVVCPHSPRSPSLACVARPPGTT